MKKVHTFLDAIRRFGALRFDHARHGRFDEAHCGQSRRRGFTMVESLLLVAILGMTAAAVGQVLVGMTGRAVSNNDSLSLNDQLLSQMEVLRSSYTTLGTGYSKSQTIKTPSGHSYTMSSSINTANPGSGTSSTFLELEVSITLPGGYNTMCTYVSE